MPNFLEALPIFKKSEKPETEKIKIDAEEKTPNRLIRYGELVISTLCKDYKVEGIDELLKFKKDHKDDKFVITGSHMNNLDVPAALATLGTEGEFNLQITGNELFMEKLKYIPQNIGVKTLFRDRFTSLGQKDEKNIESGIFRPENFTEIDEQMENNRTPWMAAHSFSLDGKMRKVDNGAVIQSYRQNAWILPTALELTAGSKNMQGVKEMAKNLKESSATYHLGQPYKPDPLPEGININILMEVVNKRKTGEKISDEEFKSFKKVNHFLSEQTEKLGKIIADMLPEEQRGYYQDNKN